MDTKKTILLPQHTSKMEIMGENIKLARLRRKLTANQISERAGIARSTLYLIEKGDIGVSIGNYFNVLRSLGLQEDILKIAQNDELGNKLQDLRLLNGDEKSDTLIDLSRKIYNKIRLGILKGNYSTYLEDVVGLDVENLKEYLNTNKFNFNINDDGFDIDHIIPLNNITTESEIESFNHYTNLQLLPKEYNRDIKGIKEWNPIHFENWYYNI